MATGDSNNDDDDNGATTTTTTTTTTMTLRATGFDNNAVKDGGGR